MTNAKKKSRYKRPRIKSFQKVIEKITVYTNFVLVLTYCMIDTLKKKQKNMHLKYGLSI